jgi:hypothetical protein
MIAFIVFISNLISIAQSTAPIKDEKRFAVEHRRDSSGNTFFACL